MFQEIDRQEGPLTRVTARQIADEFPEVAHMLILRRARNLCWLEWHGQHRKPFERSQSQLAYKIIQKTIQAEINKAVARITGASH